MTAPMRRSRLQQSQTARAQVAAIAAQDNWVFARFVVEGLGEALVEVPFPVTFSGKPFPFPGIPELDRTDSPQPGSYPSVQLSVAAWDTEDRGTGDDYYHGVTVSVIAAGRADQRIWVTCSFFGTALTNPTTE